MIKYYESEALVQKTLTEYPCVLGIVLHAGDIKVNKYSIFWSPGKRQIHTQII